MPVTNSEEAKALGRRGGRPRKLTLDRVQEALGPLETLQDAQRRLATICEWAAAGMLAGAVGGVAVRSIEVWIKANEAAITEQVAGDLRQRLEQLEGELRQAHPLEVIRA